METTSTGPEKLISEDPHFQRILNRLPIPQEETEIEEPGFFKKIVRFFLGYEMVPEKIDNSLPNNVLRAIWRIGELGISEATPRLLEYLGHGSELQTYTIICALGRCADRTAIPAIKKFATSTDYPLWIQNAAWMAMLMLGDSSDIEVIKRELTATLPNEISLAYVQQEYSTVEDLVTSTSWHYLVKLYLLNDVQFRGTLKRLLNDASVTPPAFRSLRQIFKLAEWKRDGEVFGILAHQFEMSRAMFQSSHYYAYIAASRKYLRQDQIQKMLKRPDSRIAFSSKTKGYMSRRVWRTLRHLGNDKSPEYAQMAAGVLAPYNDDQTQWKKYEWDQLLYSKLWAFNNILYRNSTCHEYNSKYVWSKTPDCKSNQISYAFPELWESKSAILLSLLKKSHSREVHEFALPLLRKDYEFVNAVTSEDVLLLILSDYEDTALFALENISIEDILKLEDDILVSFTNKALSSQVKEISELAFQIIEAQTSLFFTDKETIITYLDSTSEQQVAFFCNLLQKSVISSTLVNEVREELLKSEDVTLQATGIRLLKVLNSAEQLRHQEYLWSLCTGKEEQLRAAAQEIMVDLALKEYRFGDQFIQMIVATLLRRRISQDVELSLGTLLKEKLESLRKKIPEEIVWKLLKSGSTVAQEIGGLELNRVVSPYSISIENLTLLVNNPVISVRNTARKIFEEQVSRVRSELDQALSIADSQWEDTRKFAYDYFENNFTEPDFTPLRLIALCDSNLPDTQRFGQKMITMHFDASDGDEYLLKLSEHPASDVQLFATQYLEEYASDSVQKLQELSLYFIRVLNAVNKGRKAKKRVYNYLTNEALKSREAAEVVASIITRQSASISIEDRAIALQSLVEMKSLWPDMDLPITIHDYAEKELA